MRGTRLHMRWPRTGGTEEGEAEEEEEEEEVVASEHGSGREKRVKNPGWKERTSLLLRAEQGGAFNTPSNGAQRTCAAFAA